VTTQNDPLVRSLLEAEVPPREDVAPDWGQVLRRLHATQDSAAASRSRVRPHRKRRLLALVAATAVLVGATLAAAAGRGWWFANPDTDAPTSASDVVVVETGTWSGQPWTLTAYRATSGEICMALTPGGKENTGPGGAMSCARIPEANTTSPDLPPIAVLTGGAQGGFPAYAVGAATDAVRDVEVRLSDGRSAQAKTTAAPANLDVPARFFAVQFKCGVYPKQVIGRSEDGTTIGAVTMEPPSRSVICP
jgi:hypothetical protein